MLFRVRQLAVMGLSLTLTLIPTLSWARDAVVFEVYQALDLGDPKDPPKRDYFVSLGKKQGIRTGDTLEVHRKTTTHNLISNQVGQEVVFKIGTLKVVHADEDVAIARLEKMQSPDLMPSIAPRSIMIGDLVRALK